MSGGGVAHARHRAFPPAHAWRLAGSREFWQTGCPNHGQRRAASPSSGKFPELVRSLSSLSSPSSPSLVSPSPPNSGMTRMSNAMASVLSQWIRTHELRVSRAGHDSLNRIWSNGPGTLQVSRTQACTPSLTNCVPSSSFGR